MRTPDWKIAQAAERRAQRARSSAERHYRNLKVERLRSLRLRQAIERHRLAVTAYPHLRDEADAALWGRIDG